MCWRCVGNDAKLQNYMIDNVSTVPYNGLLGLLGLAWLNPSFDS
jgi:hypothetical protein